MIRKVEYSVTMNEAMAVGRSFFWHQFRQPSHALNYLVIAVCPLLLYVFLSEPKLDNLQPGFYFLIAAAIFLIPFEYWRYMRGARRGFESERGAEEKVVFEWDEEGFSAATPDQWQRYKWEDFVRATEDERFIKIYSVGSVYPAFIFKRPMNRSQIDDIRRRTQTLGSPAASFL